MARETQYPTAQMLQPRKIRYRNIRAVYDRDTILVYQAFPREIAEPAAAGGSFQGTDFKVDRMTWIKPSYFWTMYRSGWATKSMQEHVLAIKMKRTGFEAALRSSCLAHFESSTYSTKEEWRARLKNSTVRVQWDPERDHLLRALPRRSIQIGLGPDAAYTYVTDWVVDIVDVTDEAHSIAAQVSAGRFGEALAKAALELPYPAPLHIQKLIGLRLSNEGSLI